MSDRQTPWNKASERHALRLLAIALEQPELDRLDWLRSRCGEDQALYERVAGLLASEADSVDFLKGDPAGVFVSKPSPRDRHGERLGGAGEPGERVQLTPTIDPGDTLKSA